MKTRRMIATKPHKYGTRHLTAGEEYEVPARHALALLAGKKARFAAATSRPPKDPPQPAPVRAPPEPAAVPAPVIAAAVPEPIVVAAVERMESLRVEAERLGIEVDGRWGVARLQYEIAKARG
jgi:hypothetical protein